VFCDAEVQKVFDSGKELGLQRGGICTSSVDVIAKIDSASASPDGSGPVHTVGIFRVPHILSPEQYTPKIHPMLDKFTAMPSTQKTYQKYDLVAMGRLSIIPPSATRRPNSSFSDAGKVRYAAFNSAKIDSAYASASPDGAQNSSP
jgi:hypothetical protein